MTGIPKPRLSAVFKKEYKDVVLLFLLPKKPNQYSCHEAVLFSFCRPFYTSFCRLLVILFCSFHFSDIALHKCYCVSLASLHYLSTITYVSTGWKYVTALTLHMCCCSISVLLPYISTFTLHMSYCFMLAPSVFISTIAVM